MSVCLSVCLVVIIVTDDLCDDGLFEATDHRHSGMALRQHSYSTWSPVCTEIGDRSRVYRLDM